MSWLRPNVRCERPDQTTREETVNISRQPHHTLPSLLEVADQIYLTRLDKYNGPYRHPRVRKVGIVVFAVALFLGAACALVGVVLAAPGITNGSSISTILITIGSAATTAAVFLFSWLCSNSTFSRISRFGRMAGRIVHGIGLAASFLLSTLCFILLVYVTTVSGFNAGEAKFLGNLLVIEFLSGMIAMMALMTVPPLLTVNRRRTAAQTTQLSLGTWYFAILLLFATAVVLVTHQGGTIAIPVAVIIGLVTSVLLRLDSRRKQINDISREITAQLTDAYLKAGVWVDAPANAEAHRTLIVSLLRLQEIWTEDPAPGFFNLPVRSRVDNALQVTLEYVLTRITDMPTTESVQARAELFKEQLGSAKRTDFAVLTAEFALTLRQQVLVGRSTHPASALEPRGM
jgi:hypothetical protein